MHTAICDAIRERRLIRFYYDGGQREVEPHCYGQGKSGHDLLRGYQVSGVSRSGEAVGWKLFRVDEMTGLSASADRFSAARAGYDRFDDAMTQVYCSL